MRNVRDRLSRWVKANRRLAYISAGAFLLLALVLVPLTYSFAQQLGAAPTGLFGLPIFNGAATPDPLNPSLLDVSGNQGVPLPEPWDGAERVTILVMGLDYRDWSSGEGPARTDTMILLTVDPVARTAGIMSVPRDLWAVIPGFNPNKINTAYYFGELYNTPGGGPALAMRTVEQTLGIPIDYYAQIDFGAFVRFIDLIGGVKIDVPEEIRVDPLGADTPPLLVPEGRHTLSGEVALAYARQRYAEGGDFGRSARQQLIILGIRDRILEFNLLPGLVANSGEIYRELSTGIDTNLPLNDALKLAVLATQIERDDINQAVIGEEQIIYGRSPDDLAILIPIPDKIRVLTNEIFTSSSGAEPLAQGSPAELMAAEGALISLQNGSSSASLGSSTQSYLAGLGANVAEVTNASGQAATMVIDHTGNPYTLAFLADLMDLANVQIVHEFNPASPVDIEIRLGDDWLNNNPMP